MRKISIILMICIISACSTPPHKIASSSVSPMQYQSFSCEQIREEALRIERRMSGLSDRLHQAANNDKIIFAAGMLLVWPALFALGGTKDQEREYARLQGEYEALKMQNAKKGCDNHEN